MASFNEHYTTNRNTFRQQAEESYNQAAAANRSATDQYLADIDAIYKENARQLEHAYEQQKAQLPQDYQYAYDKNAIQQAINEREVAGRMEQLGLTDSGLNRTQQAAINVQRSNADAAVTQQQNAQLNALTSALYEQLSQNRANQTAGAAQARYDLASRNQDLYNSYMSNADSMAASIASNLYSADQQRAAAEAQANAAQNEANNQSQEGGLTAEDISNLALEMAKNDADNYRIPSGQSVYDVYNTYLNDLMGNTAAGTTGGSGNFLGDYMQAPTAYSDNVILTREQRAYLDNLASMYPTSEVRAQKLWNDFYDNKRFGDPNTAEAQIIANYMGKLLGLDNSSN